jgi:hypothetical protein
VALAFPFFPLSTKEDRDRDDDPHFVDNNMLRQTWRKARAQAAG